VARRDCADRNTYRSRLRRKPYGFPETTRFPAVRRLGTAVRLVVVGIRLRFVEVRLLERYGFEGGGAVVTVAVPALLVELLPPTLINGVRFWSNGRMIVLAFGEATSAFNAWM
jgi:hypothetical protein